jgi:GMP reductase
MRIETDPKLDFKDVLIKPKRSTLRSRSDVRLVKTYQFFNSQQDWSGIPVVAANMDGVGTFGMLKALSEFEMITALTKHYETLDLIREFRGIREARLENNALYSMGVTQDDLDKYNIVKNSVWIKMVCIDVANFYSQSAIEFLKRFREKNQDVVIFAGNVATPEITEELILAGADVVKVGIGPGSACSTRIKTGVGYPQLSAIIECADAAHGLGGHVCADGGITCPGDLAKAFGAGADFCMLGSYLAGHDEGGGSIMYANGEPHSVEFYGMSSQKAQQKNGNGLKEYRASEGRVLQVPYKGPVTGTVRDLLGGLRSACTYTGSRSLKELPKRTTFVMVHQQISTLYGVGEL